MTSPLQPVWCCYNAPNAGMSPRTTMHCCSDIEPLRLSTCRGVILEALGRFDEAITDYRAVLAAQPNDPSAWNNLGNATAGERGVIRVHRDRVCDCLARLGHHHCLPGTACSMRRAVKEGLLEQVHVCQSITISASPLQVSGQVG
jgi:hypothetical protein